MAILEATRPSPGTLDRVTACTFAPVCPEYSEARPETKPEGVLEAESKRSFNPGPSVGIQKGDGASTLLQFQEKAPVEN
jgi:hypothetical protein